MTEKNASKKKKYILGGSIICLIIVALISFSKYQEYNNNQNYAVNVKAAEKLIGEEKFSEAKRYYNIAIKYKNDSATQEKINLCDKLEISFRSFNDGIELLSKKDYLGAYNSFKGVIKEDTKRFDVAQTKMSESISLYIDDQIKMASEFANKGDFKNAIANIQLLLNLNPDDDIAKNLKKKYEDDLNKKIEVDKKTEEKRIEREKEQANQSYINEIKSTVNTVISDGTDITSKFTDKYFKSYVYSLIEKTSPDPILYSDVKDIKALKFYSENMSSLSGIEYFTALTELNCSNKVRIADASNMEYIAPGLTTLDISKNTALTKLECRYNQLTTLDLSKNTALTELYCESNKLTTLDVSKNTALTKVVCGGNKLTTLEFSKNTSLTELDCQGGQLKTLDVSKNTKLTKLDCSTNKLKILDVSKNPALLRLSCNYNELTTLKTNPKLKVLECYYNNLKTLDVSKNTALTDLNVQSNRLTTLDLSKNTKLFVLNCAYNQLTTLDISKNIVLQDILCTYNQLSSLFINNKLEAQYTQRESWGDWYKLQYTDSSHTTTTESLVMTAID